MPVSEVFDMLGEALRATGVGILGVFAVLTVFYVVIKLMIRRGDTSDS